MMNFFEEGGWGMFPVLILGFLTVASAVLFLLRPERALGGLVLALGGTTASAGMLGFAMGMMNVLRYLRDVPAEQHLVIMGQGTAESLPNLVLAAVLLVVAGIVAAIGALRASRLVPAVR